MGTGDCSLDMVFNSGKQNSNSNVNESIIFFIDWTVSSVICDHSILSSGQMTDSRSRCQHGKDLVFIFSTVSAVTTALQNLAQ